MRLTTIVVTVTLLAVGSASAQAPASAQYPYGLDPYKPSDAALLRNYGATLVAQTPLLELRKLDPYIPSHAALLRQLGGAIPLWGALLWYAPAPPPTPLTPFARTEGATPTEPNVAAVVPPNDRLSPPRLSPDRPREAAPLPPLPRPGFPRPRPDVQARAAQ
jgi:hypothetical protein